MPIAELYDKSQNIHKLDPKLTWITPYYLKNQKFKKMTKIVKNK